VRKTIPLEQTMKRTAGFFFIIWFFYPLAISLAAEMSIITEEVASFNYTENGKLTGVTTGVVREIARRLGIDCNIEVLPWARGYQRLRSEPNVALFTTARTPERKALFHWVGPLYVSSMAFYARSDDPRRIDSLDAARQVESIATYKDDSAEQILKSLGFTNLDSSNSPLSNVRKLASGRVDLWFFHSLIAPAVAREAGIEPGAIRAVHTYRKNYFYIAISKTTAPEVVREWQATLDAMKADGTFRWLTRKWLPEDSIMVSDGKTPGGRPFFLKAYTEDYPPSAYVENGKIKGLSVEIVQEILRRTGQPDTITVVPWARGYQLAFSEANVVLFSTTRLPQREALFSWVGPLYRQRWGFYRWKGSGVSVPDMEAARKVARIGTYHQDAKMQYLLAKGFDNLVPTNKNITNVAHLERGDIDLWVSSDFNLDHLARQAGVPPDQLELAYAFHTVRNYIAFSKATSPHVVRLWQSVLEEMKSDGSYRRICKKYNYSPE
jgi:polar amino acid transport system substrate-binding protein